jgi:hypothetical protein
MSELDCNPGSCACSGNGPNKPDLLAMLLSILAVLLVIGVTAILVNAVGGCSHQQRRDFNEAMAIACPALDSVPMPVDASDPLVSLIYQSMRGDCRVWRETRDASVDTE